MVRSTEGGSAAVEFALLLPLIVIILFASIEFGLTFSKVEDLESAAREGARYAAVHCQPRQTGDPGTGPCTSTMVWRAIKDSSPELTATNSAMPAGFSVSQLDCEHHQGDPVIVQWSQTFTIDVPLLTVYQQTRTLKGVFRCE